MAAARRKEWHDQQVQAAKQGSLGPCTSPGGEGPLPGTEKFTLLLWQKTKHKVRNVHRDMLKAVVQPEAAASPPRGPSSPTVAAMAGEL